MSTRTMAFTGGIVIAALAALARLDDPPTRTGAFAPPPPVPPRSRRSRR